MITTEVLTCCWLAGRFEIELGSERNFCRQEVSCLHVYFLVMRKFLLLAPPTSPLSAHRLYIVKMSLNYIYFLGLRKVYEYETSMDKKKKKKSIIERVVWCVMADSFSDVSFFFNGVSFSPWKMLIPRSLPKLKVLRCYHLLISTKNKAGFGF